MQDAKLAEQAFVFLVRAVFKPSLSMPIAHYFTTNLKGNKFIPCTACQLTNLKGNKFIPCTACQLIMYVTFRRADIPSGVGCGQISWIVRHTGSVSHEWWGKTKPAILSHVPGFGEKSRRTTQDHQPIPSWLRAFLFLRCTSPCEDS